MLAFLVARQNAEAFLERDADRGADMGDCMELDCMKLLDDEVDNGEGILCDVP